MAYRSSSNDVRALIEDSDIVPVGAAAVVAAAFDGSGGCDCDCD